ncbi:MAG: hypothetical protein AB1416_10930, partial [Actinomycetota bacterium]
MSEFLNDGQRDAYVDALRREMTGYEARESAAVAVGNKDLAAFMRSRKAQVQDEITRVTGDDDAAAAAGIRKSQARKPKAGEDSG